MSIFSLNWFRAKKREMDPIVDAIVEREKFKTEILKRELNRKDEKKKIKENRYYKRLSLVNDVLTIILNDGSIIVKPDSNPDEFNAVRAASTEVAMLDIIKSSLIINEEAKKNVSERKKVMEYESSIILGKLSDFELKEGSVYLKGIDRSVPGLLVAKFAQIADEFTDKNGNINEVELSKDDEFVSLKRFFMWCCLNPRAEVAEDLYGFLEKNGFKFTKQGFFIALRNVVDVKKEDSEIVHFISNAYNKVKAVWKQNPDNYRVEEKNGNFILHKVTAKPEGSIVGNLTTLYLNLPDMEENRFTDDWTKTFDIRIGRKVWMDPSTCSWSTKDCAEAGLHFAGYTAPYVLCGDTTVFTIINPMKVVGIGKEKGRCYEYLPFMTTNIEEADQIMNAGDFDFLQLDEQYAIDELKDLEEKVKDGFAKESKKHQFNIPSISTDQIRGIVKSLSAMEKELQKRIIKIN